MLILARVSVFFEYKYIFFDTFFTIKREESFSEYPMGYNKFQEIIERKIQEVN